MKVITIINYYIIGMHIHPHSIILIFISTVYFYKYSIFYTSFNEYIWTINFDSYQDFSIFSYPKINLRRRVIYTICTSDKTMSISLVEIEQIRRDENFLSNFSYCRNSFFASSMHFDLALIIAFLFVLSIHSY